MLPKSKFNIYWLLALSLTSCAVVVQADSHIPHLCDNVNCPPLSELHCPEDSDIRELISEPLIMEEEFNNASQIDPLDEAFAFCCLSQKCVCKTCYIPDCANDGEVVVEISPESMDKPGHCCGEYECHKEPNCTAEENTDSYWLSDCQRCKCQAGQKICHQICDEGIKKTGAICESKNLNKFFEHGDTWKDGCYDCRCVNGEPNCVINFCSAVDCPAHRQVTLKNSCCPVCWPKGFPMPNGDDEYDDNGDSGHHYDDVHDYNEVEDNVEPNLELKPILEVENATNSTSSSSSSTTTSTTSTTAAPSTSITEKSSTTTTSTSTTSTTSTTTPKPEEKTTQSPVEFLHKPTEASTTSPALPCPTEGSASTSTTTSTTPGPCSRQDAASYQVYPQVVELMRYSQHNGILYTIIGCLSVLVVGLTAWNIHLKAKQRSYRPVSNFDDNCNTMSNIKKTNDYV
ncbi:kielin/chordin-like protein [Musca domestica]|uniref:Kielin/chordin-like protein n=1 Tax=Musca domestica TaxID=7370 RepID=A0ABM3V376_MUSDO|nr:kielin/chordin-like protein [Musca domestica]